MTDDPIVEKGRAIRDQYAARFGYDLAAIFDDLKQGEDSRDLQKYPLAESVARRLKSGRH